MQFSLWLSNCPIADCPPYKLSDLKLSDYMIGSKLVENTWSFKPITFQESVMCMPLNHFTCVSTNSSQITQKKNHIGRLLVKMHVTSSVAFLSKLRIRKPTCSLFFLSCRYGLAGFPIFAVGRERIRILPVVPGLIFGLVTFWLTCLALHRSLRVSLCPLCWAFPLRTKKRN